MFLLQFTIGAIIGSFLQLVNVRRLAGQSIVTPRSRCDVCRQSLKWYDLIPILSYVWLHGKCRRCGTRIPFATLVCEFLAGTCVMLLQPTIVRTALIGLGLLLILISARDTLCQQIPQSWLICLFLIAITTRVAMAPPTWLTLTIVIGWALLQFNTAELKWLGLGDLDILCCLAVLFSLEQLAWFVLIASLTALATCYITRKRRIAFTLHLAIGYLITLAMY